MSMTTKYFTNTSNFEEIAETVRTAETLPDQIDSNFLDILGYSNPANELILDFFKDLKFLKEDNTPTSLLEKFRETETPKKVFAHSILEAYGELFDKEPTIYQQSKEEIKQQFQSCLNDDKSNIIISYMVNTFKVVVDYAGHETIAEVWEKKNSDNFSQKEQQETDTDIKNNQLKNEKNNGEREAPKASSISTLVNGRENGQKEEAEVKKVDEEAETEEKVEVGETVEANKKEGEEAPAETQKAESSEEDKEIEVHKAGLTSMDLTLPVAPEVEMTEEVKRADYINKAYIKKAELLYRLGRFEEALPALDKVYQKFADSSEDELYKAASVALIKKKDVAEKLELNDYLIPIYSTIIERWDTKEEKEFTSFVDQAYINITDILLENDQIERALEKIEKAIQRFKEAERNPDFLVKAMYQKAELLEQSELNQGALKAYDEVLKLFSDSSENE